MSLRRRQVPEEVLDEQRKNATFLNSRLIMLEQEQLIKNYRKENERANNQISLYLSVLCFFCSFGCVLF